ncbi:alpha/beta fold hydrolase [Amycolatopsis sp. DG1A-15b]|uniref:alpha/beta hydrolase n=1 Tax=Amycolatopsis sp. DG1A-15b TaxID=3052846 RepID=UPI00255B5ED8|nr:alpha/beta fold hydrolase [Amycolatopsis sp. DG1A-15b]WIX89883.1 alpha/beta fold hydrolase [Amycolatopsis sp. DG1A-15b]
MTRTVLVRVLVVAVVVLVLLLAAFWAVQRRLIYLPDPAPVPAAASVLPGAVTTGAPPRSGGFATRTPETMAEDIHLRTADGLDLGAWYLHPAGRDPAATVLVAGGNGGNRAGRAPLAAKLAQAGLAVLLLDYRGYGGNPGDPSEDGLALDVRAAHRFLTEDRRVPPGRLIYFGESLGSAVVTELALEHPPAGLLLRSPFADLAAVGAESYPYLPVRLLLRDRFPVKEQAARLHVPAVVVAGGRDSIVPPSQSREVAAAASARLVEIPGADHNDPVLLDGPELVEAVLSLVPR